MNESLTLIIKNKSESLYLRLKDILYIEADGNYSNIYFVDGSVLKALSYQRAEIARMMQEQFPRVWTRSFEYLGRSYIINLNYILRIQPHKQMLTFRTNMFGSHKKMSIKAPTNALNELSKRLAHT